MSNEKHENIANKVEELGLKKHDDGYYISQQKDIIDIKRIIYDEYDGVCPVTGEKLDLEDFVVDHKHKTKKDIPGGDDRLGFIRGNLSNGANTVEGRAYNYFVRMGLHSKMKFTNFLRNLADFLDNHPTSKVNILHYTEVAARKKLKISEWKRVIKYYLEIYPTKRKIPKKPTYYTEDVKKWISDVDDHILKLKEEKEERKRLREEKKLNKY
jgi:hypothetical protein